MAYRVFLSGSAGSGKTALCVGLVAAMARRDLRVGYLKPVANQAAFAGEEDPDVTLMRALLGHNGPSVESVVYRVGPNYLARRPQAGQLEAIKARADAVSREVDVLFLESTTSPQAGASVGLDSFTLARALGAHALMVDRATDDLDLDVMVVRNQHMRCLGVPIAGNVLNNVSRLQWDKSLGVYKPLLESLGFPVIGVVPRRTEITAPTAGEVRESLGAEVLAGESGLGRAIEEIVVGAMSFESALRYLRRATNKAVVTGGDRADVALAALETSTSVLVLTGGLFPNVQVIQQANERGVPVLLVSEDTYTTVEKLGRIGRRLRPDDEESLRVAREVVERHVDVEALLKQLQAESH